VLSGFSCSRHGGSSLLRHGRTTLPAHRKHLLYRVTSTEQSKPVALPGRGSEVARLIDGDAGVRSGRKRMLFCNGADTALRLLPWLVMVTRPSLLKDPRYTRSYPKTGLEPSKATTRPSAVQATSRPRQKCRPGRTPSACAIRETTLFRMHRDFCRAQDYDCADGYSSSSDGTATTAHAVYQL